MFILQDLPEIILFGRGSQIPPTRKMGGWYLPWRELVINKERAESPKQLLPYWGMVKLSGVGDCSAKFNHTLLTAPANGRGLLSSAW